MGNLATESTTDKMGHNKASETSQLVWFSSLAQLPRLILDSCRVILEIDEGFPVILCFEKEATHRRQSSAETFADLSTSMASPLQKLLRKSPAARLIAALYERPAKNRIAPIVVNKPPFAEIKPDGGVISDPSLLSASSETNFSTSSPMSQIYPSFPFGYCYNPVWSRLPAQSPSQSEEQNDGLDESGKVWADSVKKKRKKKMNKHKYRKLRKRLRRQT